MAKDPAVLLYTQDFLVGTMLMTDEQVGKYIRLLCLQHQQGYLTEDDIMKICRTYDEKVFSKFVRDPANKFYNDRMQVEIEKRQRYTESRRRNLHKDKHMADHMAVHMENVNENVIDNGDVNKMEKEKKLPLKQRKLELIERRKELFFQNVAKFTDQYPPDMITQFCDYWSETNKSGSQMRWEMERTWEFGKRLATWSRRSKPQKPEYHATDF